MTRLIREDDRLLIRVCGGMHCSGAGGGRTIEAAFCAALAACGIADRAEVLRAHCLGACADGPCVRIAGERFYGVQAADAPDLVREEVLPRVVREDR